MPRRKPETTVVPTPIPDRGAVLGKVFETMETNNLTEVESDMVMKFAQSHLPNGGAEMDLDDMDDEQFNKMIRRANHGIRTIVANRVSYSAGPFFTNRKMRKAEEKRARKRRKTNG
jgi:hypothetical protein